MADKEKKEELTLEQLQDQLKEVNKQIKTLTDENKTLKESNAQKDLEIAKLSLGGSERKITKEEKEDEDVSFDFDF